MVDAKEWQISFPEKSETKRVKSRLVVKSFGCFFVSFFFLLIFLCRLSYPLKVIEKNEFIMELIVDFIYSDSMCDLNSHSKVGWNWNQYLTSEFTRNRWNYMFKLVSGNKKWHSFRLNAAHIPNKAHVCTLCSMWMCLNEINSQMWNQKN